MPPIFRTLASITAWILWICGLLTALIILVCMAIRGDLFSTDMMQMADIAALALAGGLTFLGVVVMRLRQKME
ncbi:MAG TPA: hypothetical protein VGA85_01165 [Dehalococcoidales bacterium]